MMTMLIIVMCRLNCMTPKYLLQDAQRQTVFLLDCPTTLCCAYTADFNVSQSVCLSLLSSHQLLLCVMHVNSRSLGCSLANGNALSKMTCHQ